MDDNQRTPQQRAALITLRMAQGQRFTTAQAAEFLGITHQGAHRLLSVLGAGEIPVARDEGGRWYLTEYIY